MGLYTDLAEWWPLLSAPEEYADEAAFYTRVLKDACDPTEVLELGSGGGNNALHMKAHFDLTLMDLSESMLAVSRKLNPECRHLPGDMRDARLGREFDAVFIHDAICYITKEEDLRATFETAYVHCRPGGAALFCPDYVSETFRTGTAHGGHDGDGRSMRYLDWTFDPDPDDDTYVVDMIYVMREGDDDPQVVSERWIEGLFSRDRWLALLREVGFEPRVLTWDNEDAPLGSTVFLGIR